MSLYLSLLWTPPKLHIDTKAKEVVFHLVSVMCDNKSTIKLKKNTDGEFRLYTGINAFRNFQMKHHEYEIEWAADEGNWPLVIDMINSGTSKIEKVKYR